MILINLNLIHLITLGHPKALTTEATKLSKYSTTTQQLTVSAKPQLGVELKHTHTHTKNPNLCRSLVRSTHLSHNDTRRYIKHTQMHAHKQILNCMITHTHRIEVITHTCIHTQTRWCENSEHVCSFTLHSDAQTEDYTKDNPWVRLCACLSVCLSSYSSSSLSLSLLLSVSSIPKHLYLIVTSLICCLDFDYDRMNGWLLRYV